MVSFSQDFGFDDLVILGPLNRFWLTFLIALQVSLQSIDDIHSGNYSAKDGMVTIKFGSWRGQHKKLRASRVGFRRSGGHAHRAAKVLASVLFSKLVINGVTNWSRPLSGVTPGLGQKATLDLMKQDPIEVADFNEAYEIANRLRRFVLKQLDYDVAFRRFEFDPRQIIGIRLPLPDFQFAIKRLLQVNQLT